MSEESIVLFLRAQIGEFTAKMKEAGADVQHLGEKSAGHFNQLASVGKAALLGIGGAAIAGGAYAVKLADEFEKAHARLEVALTNTGTSFEATKGQIDKLVQSGTAFGYNATDIQGALAQMTTGLGSSSKAIGAFGVVEDLAAKTGKPLNEAALAVTKAMEGQLRPLKQLGIDLPVAAGGALKVEKAQVALVAAQTKLNSVTTAMHDGLLKGKSAWFAYEKASEGVTAAQHKLNTTQATGQTILSMLGAKLDGSASAAANTFGGKIAALKATGENLFITIGLRLVPILEKLAATLLVGVQYLEKHKAVAIALGVVLGGALLVAIGAYAASLVVAGGALNLFTVATVTAEGAAVAFQITVLGWVIVIAAIVAAVYLLVTHWSEAWAKIKEYAATAWDAIKAATSVAWAAIVSFFKGLPARILSALQTVGSKIAQLFSTAMSFLGSHLPGYFKTAAEWFVALPIIIIGYLALFTVKLIAWAASAFVSLVKALPGLAVGMLVWWANLQVLIISKLAGFAMQFVGWAGKAFVALVKALPGFIVATISFFAGLPGKIIGAIGAVDHLLYDIGAKIISGLLDGIKSAIGGVKDFLGGVASKIVSWKGPPSHDATILVNNGRLIMQGLQSGLASGMSDVRKQLTGFTAEIGGTHSVHFATTAHAAVMSSGNGALLPANTRSTSSGGDTYITLTVHAIDGPSVVRTVVPALNDWARSNGKKLVMNS